MEEGVRGVSGRVVGKGVEGLHRPMEASHESVTHSANITASVTISLQRA